MPHLIEPGTELAPSFLAAMADFAGEGRGTPSDHSALGRQLRDFAADWHAAAGFERFLTALRQEGDVNVAPPANWVHSSTLWWAQGTQYLGSIRIRHQLTPALTEIGGHIGYVVRPSARRKGYATQMLVQSLPIAAGLGIDPALVTCDVDNIGSRKVIEANGGVLEDQRAGMLRYWVPTTPARG
jgi:predicted acetyltransferase